jgi:hypothetical protein
MSNLKYPKIFQKVNHDNEIHLEEAQYQFEKWLADAPRVFGHHEVDDRLDYTQWRDYENSDHEITHQALLVCIEKLPKKECEHEPAVYLGGNNIEGYGANCKRCGVKLKAKWEPL